MCAEQFDQQGILTDDDIQFLRGDDVPGSAEQRSRARQRIRERVASTIQDFEVLLEYWPEEQQRKTLDLIEENSEKPLEEIGAEMIAFLYMFSNVSNTQPEIIREEDPVRHLMRFRSSLSRGIRKGKRTFGHSPGVVSVATTTRLHEKPDSQIVREEVDSRVLSDAIRKINDKYELSVAYEDDERVLDMTDRVEAVEELFFEWDEKLATQVIGRRQKSDDFVYSQREAISSKYEYRDDFEKNPDSDT